MLCRVGFEQSSPVRFNVKCYKRSIEALQGNGLNYNWLHVVLWSVLDVLMSLVVNNNIYQDDFWEDERCEYWITQLLRMGLLFPERGVFFVTDILFALHSASVDVATKSFRICRQLLRSAF